MKYWTHVVLWAWTVVLFLGGGGWTLVRWLFSSSCIKTLYSPCLLFSHHFFPTQKPSFLWPSAAALSDREAPGQFPLPSFAACHVVYSAQLFKKCWISTIAFTGALSTFVWSNLAWMRWFPEQGELGCSVHRSTSGRPAPGALFHVSLQHSELLWWWFARMNVCRLCATDVTNLFQSSLWGSSPGPTGSQLLKVCLTPRDQSEPGEYPECTGRRREEGGGRELSGTSWESSPSLSCVPSLCSCVYWLIEQCCRHKKGHTAVLPL